MEPEKKSNGAIVGLVIIIIILLVGGIYMWKVNKDSMEAMPNQSETITTEDSAELNSLEAELETANTNTGVEASTVN